MIKLFFKFSIGSWLSAAISLFTTPIVTALIIPAEFGKASMYILAYNLVLQVVLMGADQSFTRKFFQEPSEAHQSRILFNSIAFPFLFSCLVAISVFVLGDRLGPLLVNSNSHEFNTLLAASIVVGVFERFSMLALRMKKRAMSFSLIRVLFSVINFLVIFCYAHYVKKDFYAIIYGNFLGLTICTLVAALLVKNLWKIKKLDFPLIKRIFAYGFPFLPTFVAYWLFEGIDKMALRHYTDFHEIGLFTAAYKIVAILSILQTAFSTFWAPVAFEMYEKCSDTARDMFSKSLTYMCAAFFICGAGMILFKDVVIILFEKSYRSASSIMPFLLLVPIMYTLSEVTVGGINYKNKTYWHLVIALIAAAANYGLNILLVPLYGAKGAAIATGISYIVFFYARTYISDYLFPLKINYTRIHLSVLLFLAVAYLNTFYPNGAYNFLATSTAIILFFIYYRNELGQFIKILKQKMVNKSLAVQK